MPGRTLKDTSYKFGFNGKENDAENGLQDYGFRFYNTGLCRFLSVDPLTKDYPWYTPYQFAGNKPIEAIDLDGLEEEKKVETLTPDIENEKNDGNGMENIMNGDETLEDLRKSFKKIGENTLFREGIINPSEPINFEDKQIWKGPPQRPDIKLPDLPEGWDDLTFKPHNSGKNTEKYQEDLKKYEEKEKARKNYEKISEQYNTILKKYATDLENYENGKTRLRNMQKLSNGRFELLEFSKSYLFMEFEGGNVEEYMIKLEKEHHVINSNNSPVL
ncbi:MAG: RHS repeat-associated core domain-containing protein [Chitinophagaceae bacterium]|nr:RHS repeat-associated core domain-containing protein [Chitinophagaceae bacterium]